MQASFILSQNSRASRKLKSLFYTIKCTNTQRLTGEEIHFAVEMFAEFHDEAERLREGERVSERCGHEKSREIKLSCLPFPGHPYSEWQCSGNTNKQAR